MRFAVNSLINGKNYFCYKRYYLFKKSLDKDFEKMGIPAIKAVVLNIVSDCAQLDSLIAEGYDIKSLPIFCDLQSGLKKGAKLFFVFSGKECAHASMVVMDKNIASLTDSVFKKIAREDAGYIGPCYTHPLYRGKGLYPYVLNKICELLKKEGKNAAFINTKTTNKASARGITKAGFNAIAEVSHLRLMFCDFYNKQGIKNGICIQKTS